VKDDKIKNLQIFDALPHSLGFLNDDGLINIMVKKNESIPYSIKETFWMKPNQSGDIEIKIYEGES
jgi:molecular chaperone DnaK (HSP70)